MFTILCKIFYTKSRLCYKGRFKFTTKTNVFQLIISTSSLLKVFRLIIKYWMSSPFISVPKILGKRLNVMDGNMPTVF